MEESEAPKRPVLIIIGLSFLFTIGLLLEILSCIFWGGWWLIFVVFIFGFVPLPTFFCGRYAENDPIGTNGLHFRDWGNFFTGFLISAGLGLPLMMAHTQMIRTEGLIAGLIGGVLVCVAVSLYILKFLPKNQEF